MVSEPTGKVEGGDYILPRNVTGFEALSVFPTADFAIVFCLLSLMWMY